MAAHGRATIARLQRDVLKEEVHALRAERREWAGELIPISRYLWQHAAITGDPAEKRAARQLVHITKRLSGNDDAA